MPALFAAHRDYAAAKAAMLAADTLGWPGDPLRDAVQAQGMRFCDQWRSNAETIATIVAADPERFSFYHTPDKKGTCPDPREYSAHHRIMELLLDVSSPHAACKHDGTITRKLFCVICSSCRMVLYRGAVREEDIPRLEKPDE